jgi:hypothetical protein
VAVKDNSWCELVVLVWMCKLSIHVFAAKWNMGRIQQNCCHTPLTMEDNQSVRICTCVFELAKRYCIQNLLRGNSSIFVSSP